ncbi:MAG: type III secretion system translocon subunit SctE [Zoogloeaceae bacterium]|jgi:hypothetical protein|nr:type III secretion system translocon subunit SctE [Zoogloeaceae bacterium]
MTTRINEGGAAAIDFNALMEQLAVKLGESGQGKDGLPPVTSSANGTGSTIALELPKLVAPMLSALGVSLEELVRLVGSEERKVATETSTQSLKAKAKERKEICDKNLEELKKQIDKENSPLGQFLKAFKFIAIIVQAIGAAVAFATGNAPLGILLTALMVDQIISAATNGEQGLTAWVTNIAKECGASDEVAQWVGFAFTIATVIATVGVSVGTSMGQVLTATEKMLTAVTTMVSAGQQIAQGGLAIGQAVENYQVATSKAHQKELQAMLERIRTAIDLEQDFLKIMLEKFQNMLAKVNEVISNTSDAQAAVLAGGGRALA